MSKAAFGMENCIDIFKKLEFDYESLDSVNTNPYYLFNFLTTAKHIIEWIIEDNNIDKYIRDEIGGVGKLQRSNKDFFIINSLCNHSKHFVLKDKKKELNKKEEHSFLDFNNIDFNNFYFEKYEYYVEYNNTYIKVYDICTRYFNFMNDFINKHKEEFVNLKYL